MRVAIVVLVSGLLGCATIVSKNDYPVLLDSSPTGASLIVRNASGVEVYKGDAPTTVTLSTRGGYFRPQSYLIEANLEGYEVGRSTLRARLDGWYFGNIAIGGLIGMVIVDPLTGAMWRFAPSHTLELEPAPSPMSPEHPERNSDPRLSFDECFERCLGLTGRSKDQCFDVCASR